MAGTPAESAWSATSGWDIGGIAAPMVIKGAMNGEAFLTYLEQCLIPGLKRGDTVVIDKRPVPQSPRRTGSNRGCRRYTCRGILRISILSSWFFIPEDIPAQGCGAHDRTTRAMHPLVYSGARSLGMYGLFRACGL
jgi:hypothetical protein